MPVTVRLSRLFYERLGEQIANELVDWFNLVDSTYKADLRELNEVNYLRFETKLDSRIDAVRAEMRARFDQVDARFTAVDAKFTAIDAKFTAIDAKLTGIDGQFGTLESKIDFKMERWTAEIKAELERRLGEQTRWLFVVWSALLIPIIGLWFR